MSSASSSEWLVLCGGSSIAAMAPELLVSTRRYIELISVRMRPNTVRKYGYAIREFIRFLELRDIPVKTFRDLRRLHAESWLRSLARRPIKGSTRAKKITYLRLFFERMADWDWEEVPQERVLRMSDMPPEDQYLPRPLSGESDRLLIEALTRRATVISRAILFLRRTGLRSQELLDLEVDSLNEASPTKRALRVPLGKLHSERVVPVDRDTARLFEELRELRGSPPPAPHPERRTPIHYLLQRPDGRRYRYDELRFYLRAIEKEARLPEHVTLHRLRHTYATELLRAGMPLECIMKLLGHRTLRMTLRYVAVSGAQVCGEYERALERLPDRERFQVASPRGWTPGRSPKEDSDLLRVLEDLATRLEGLRRDRKDPGQKRQLWRLVERARALRRDLPAVLR
jgi:site-specific recombinase XerD